jgi:RNA polymerase sigma factor (sigma-70 family)
MDAATALPLAEVFARERPRLVRLCARLSGSSAAAEDLAQETLVEAWRHRQRLHDSAGQAAWLSAIARNVCLRWQRRAGRERGRVDQLGGAREEEGDPIADRLAADVDLEIELERSELAELLDRAMALLPPETRQILVQRYIEDRPQAEVAARLGMTEGAVAVRLHRGKLSLRRLLVTDLSAEAAGYGLLARGAGWEPTRVWCMSCGRARLTALYGLGDGVFETRCSCCRSHIEHRRGAPLTRRLGFRQTYLAVAEEAGRYYQGALAEGGACCLGCGRWTPLRMELPAELPQASTAAGVHVRCAACGTLSLNPVRGLVMSMPPALHLWQGHGRIETSTTREIEHCGRPALLIHVESLVAPAGFDVLLDGETFTTISVT